MGHLYLYLLGNWIFLQLMSASDVTPRLNYLLGNPSRVLKHFSKDGVENYSTFLLSEDEQTLYVGARDLIISFNIAEDLTMEPQQELIWTAPETKRTDCKNKGKNYTTECFNLIQILQKVNETHLYTCGTFAFSPLCAYIDIKTFSLVKNMTEDGKGRCPFDPTHKFAATMVDGELYAGTMNKFHGTDPIITRTLGQRNAMKTENSLNWLQDSVFVGSDFVSGSEGDDKVYFFFTETAKEYDFLEEVKVPRAARICTSDSGGERVLQKKWTTFLKAQLSCNMKNDIPYNIIQDSFFLSAPDSREDSVFYGVFNFQWKGRREGSQTTVCAFRLGDMEKVFNGKYMKLNKEMKWKENTDTVPSPRPGSCSVNASLDNTLTFMKEHFLMSEKVLPIGKQPLLVLPERYTKIVVEQVLVPFKEKKYNVMFLGTELGFLHKIVTANTGPHIIENIQLFREHEPVQNLLLSPRKGVLYVGYSSGILQIPVANCSAYRTCDDCVLARDPYCGWNTKVRICHLISPEMKNESNWQQDVEEGDQSSCRSGVQPRSRQFFPAEEISAELNSIVMLSCSAPSEHATLNWTYNRNKLGSNYVLLPNMSLMVIVKKDTLGDYECKATENEVSRTVTRYLVQLLPSSSSEAPEKKDGEEKEEVGMEKETVSYSTNQDVETETISYTTNVERDIEKIITHNTDLKNKLPPKMPESKKGEQTLSINDSKSYWPNFVVVSILLAMTLITLLALTFYVLRGKSKSKVKVGNSTSMENKKLNPGEVEDHYTDQEAKQEEGDCSVHMERLEQEKKDVDHYSSKSPGITNGETLTANHS